MNHSLSETLFFKLRKVGNSLTRFQRHKSYLEKCNSYFMISKGFLKDTSVSFEDTNLMKKCQLKQDKALWEIQQEVTSWLGQKVLILKKDFIRIKARMFQVAKDRAKRFLFTVRQEMTELEKKLDRVMKWDKIYENGRKYDQDDRIDINTESQIRTHIPKHRRGNKRKLKGSKRNQKKKRRRRRMIERKKAEIKDLLSKANEKELPENMFHPLDNTDYNWQELARERCMFFRIQVCSNNKKT